MAAVHLLHKQSYVIKNLRICRKGNDLCSAKLAKRADGKY